MQLSIINFIFLIQDLVFLNKNKHKHCQHFLKDGCFFTKNKMFLYIWLSNQNGWNFFVNDKNYFKIVVESKKHIFERWLNRVKKKNKDITKVKILSKHCDKFHDYTKPFYNNFCMVIYKNMSMKLYFNKWSRRIS